jgi:retron-type reverse transcriptase
MVVAHRRGDISEVHRYQTILMHCKEARALAVRKVTSTKGANTPGVDRVV